jgi:uncharacterized protein
LGGFTQGLARVLMKTKQRRAVGWLSKRSGVQPGDVSCRQRWALSGPRQCTLIALQFVRCDFCCSLSFMKQLSLLQQSTTTMKTFDSIEVRRPALAKSYLGLIVAQPGRPLAMFAPRRVGKTYFLDHDLAPAARLAKWLPVYADLWLQKSAPLEAINHALEEALDDATVPGSGMGRLAKTAVKKLGALGVSLDLADAPARRALPTAPELRLDALVVRLAAAAGKPILLMLDEIQALGDVANGEKVIATLRAVLHKRRDILKSVFTGSSQEAMVRMLSTAGSPMYQFAQLLDFPVLGDEFLQQLADHFANIHPGKSLPLDGLQRVFAKIGFKPGLMKDVVKSVSVEGLTDIDLGLRRFLLDDRQLAGWIALLQPLGLFERAVILAIAQGLPPMGRETLDALAEAQGSRPTVAKVRAAIERLRRAGLLVKAGNGPAAVDDPLFAEYLRGRSLDQLR